MSRSNDLVTKRRKQLRCQLVKQINNFVTNRYWIVRQLPSLFCRYFVAVNDKADRPLIVGRSLSGRSAHVIGSLTRSDNDQSIFKVQLSQPLCLVNVGHGSNTAMQQIMRS